MPALQPSWLVKAGGGLGTRGRGRPGDRAAARHRQIVSDQTSRAPCTRTHAASALAIAGKGAAPRQERQRLADAADSDSPTPAQFVEAFFGLKAQAEKLQRIEDRLERVAVLAEDSASPNAVAQVAAQQLRSVEVGARVAGVGGYSLQRAPELAGGQTFSINIHFASTGETVSISPVLGSVPTDITGIDEDDAADPDEP